MQFCDKKCCDGRGFEVGPHIHVTEMTVYQSTVFEEWRDHPARPAVIEGSGNIRYNVKPYEPSTQGGRKGRRR